MRIKWFHIWTILNPLHPRVLFVGWNWPSGSGEKILKFTTMYFCYFIIFSLWKRAWPFIWRNGFPLAKDASCQVWLKLAQWFWRRRWKCEKFTDRLTDDRQSEKLASTFRSDELKILPNRKMFTSSVPASKNILNISLYKVVNNLCAIMNQ